ncbi:hypothetical protein [Solibaculum mannosilyticum]|uniref:Uncharacterized protein n=1 Tax=Solibaculum mannosilyticum TaxID=2780922 RepID=A0A7I8CZP3_9FIRM|nr:hypothetical protein [Solibaculum mannosilyticum]MCO7136957.1 hypothetical protein [[Clostridium] leptum]BCI59980.1 hypothetical protein C12CBH8_06190 [Solibaculum mannosilyticum]CZT57133.1 hypothetical protein BN3661_01816 [Eubacteriaceae bacterium CHKCI005]
MTEHNLQPAEVANGCFKEAVCIDAGRIYDSCGDKDCLEDLRVYFTECNQRVIDQAINVRSRSAEVISVFLDVEAVPFNRGFYSVDMTFFFEVTVDVYSAPNSCPCTISGLAMFDKKVILYGSEGSVKIFSSDYCDDENDYQNRPTRNLPKAVCQVADPIVLSARLCEPCDCRPDPCCCIPNNICSRFGGDLGGCTPGKILYITLGIFTIVQLERNVQMLIPVYDFCVPSKECVSSSDNPCELFRRIQFPTDQFFPPRAEDLNCDDKPPYPRGGCC